MAPPSAGAIWGTLFSGLLSDIVVRCCPSSILTETFRSESTWQVGKNSSRVSARARPRRLWLFGRFQALVELAASTGKLRRVFIWGSFVTAKPVPRDVDTLLIMDEDFEVDRIPAPARVLFDAIQSKLLFESDVFWARASIGEEVLQLWLDTYQTTRNFGKRGIVELELR